MDGQTEMDTTTFITFLTNTHARTHAHTYTRTCNGPYLDFTGARDSEWQWHQLGHVQVCTSFQTDNHASTSPLTLLIQSVINVRNLGVELWLHHGQPSAACTPACTAQQPGSCLLPASDPAAVAC